MMNKVVFDSTRPVGQRCLTNVDRPYLKGWRDASAKITHWLRRGATVDDIASWMDGPLKAWIERGNPQERVPDIGEAD